MDKFVTLVVTDCNGDYVDTMELNEDSVKLFQDIVTGLGGATEIIATYTEGEAK